MLRFGFAKNSIPYVLEAQVEQNSGDILNNSSGVAMSITMMNATASMAPGERGAIGIGFGTFAGQQSIAIGSSFRFGDKDQTQGVKVLFNSSAGFGLNRNTFGAGAGFSFRF